MKNEHKPTAELLSPAGSFQTLKAVEAAGADAVYGAGRSFGARAYADNFTDTELKEAIDYMHLCEKRFYLAVNTLLKETELQGELYDFIEPLYRQGLDGVIVQDLGVLSFLRRNFPKLELHASTQMTISGAYGAKLLKKAGCSRIVPARELSLEEIKWIHDTVDIEIESFVHGALCYCYSGQCLFSSLLGGRSGNRGRCAQPCRLPYGAGKGKDASYLLSMKDLCTIELMPALLESGVYSFKIEGRMKQTEYAAGVTAIYRKYLDEAQKKGAEGYLVEEADLDRLKRLGSRSGFTSGYYKKQNGPDMMSLEKSSHTKAEEESRSKDQEQLLGQERKEKINGILILLKDNPAQLVLKCKGREISVTGDTVQKAKSSPMEKDSILEKMNKTKDTPFLFRSITIQMEDDIFIPVGALNRLRREGLALLKEELVREFRRSTLLERAVSDGKRDRNQRLKEENQKSGSQNTDPSYTDTGEGKAENPPPYLAASIEDMEQITPVLASPFVSRIYMDWQIFNREGQETGADRRRTSPKSTKEKAEIGMLLREAVKDVHAHGKEIYYVMPAIFRKPTAQWYEKHWKDLMESGMDGFVVKNLEELEFLREYAPKDCVILSDGNLYCWSGEAVSFLKENGVRQVTLPAELNARELLSRTYPGGELCIYGRQPLMISAQCITKNTDGCKRKSGSTFLTDRKGKRFLVKRFCEACYNVIYNTSPLSLLHQYREIERQKADGYRLSFTLERADEVERTLALYEAAFIRKEPLDREAYLKNFTNGHLKRGVE